MLGFVVLPIAAIVHCVRQNPKHINIRSRVSLVRGNKEVVCYERDLFQGQPSYENPAWHEDRLHRRRERRKSEELRIKQIVEALGAAIGQR